jgi:diadenylate cyclase
LKVAAARECVNFGLLKHMGEFLTANWPRLVEVFLLGGLLVAGWRILRGAGGSRIVGEVGVVLMLVMLLAHLLGLELVRMFAFFCGVILVVVFQPEVRRAFVNLGSNHLFGRRRATSGLLDLMEDAVQQLSAKRFGALFAFERGMDLDQYAETGVEIEAKFTPELVLTLFHPKTSLHDGGVILRQGRLQAAGCVFPVSQRELNDRSMGLRHRAAIGITEQTDAIAVVVSEETGNLSICADGELYHALSIALFREKLGQLLQERSRESDREKEPAEARTATKRLEA